MLSKSTKVHAAGSFPPKRLVYPPQPNFAHNRYANEMNDHSSRGRQAMDILKEKLANANQDPAANAPNVDVTTQQHPDLSYSTMLATSSDPHDVQAHALDSNEITGSNEFVISHGQSVQRDASFSDLNGNNGMYEASSASQQQNEYHETMLSGLTGALTIMPPAFNDDNVGRDVFSNDHLSSEIVPLEDPAEAFALSQSTVPIALQNRRSRQLNLLTCGPNQCPTAAAALSDDNFPFVEGARMARATPAHGVVRLRDIPEATRRNEILAIMGRNSKVLNDVQEPVHIIIERVNAATREAYVEFMDEKSAEDVIERFDLDKKDGHGPRLGEYPVRYELSSQAALMKTLFPRAKGVQWIGATPHIIPSHQIRYSWDLFKGFITPEEMSMLAKHGESNKAGSCPQRPYECMISTLRKMPWYMIDQITVFQRYSVYDATVRLIQSLQKQINYKNNIYLLNKQLLERLWTSAMLCHGFSVTQKYNIAYCVNLSDERMRDFNMPRFPEDWVHTHTLVPKPGTPLDVLEWYIAIIRETTTREVEQLPPNELRELRHQVGDTSLYWGYYWKVLRLDDLAGPAIDNMTLGDMARREFRVITGILKLAFGGQQAGLEQQQQPCQVGFGQQQLIDPYLVNEGQQFGTGGQ